MDVLISILVIAYLAAGLRRVHIARRPSYRIALPYQKYFHFPRKRQQRPFLAVLPNENESTIDIEGEEQETQPLFPRIKTDKVDLAFGEMDLAYDTYHKERNIDEKSGDYKKKPKRNIIKDMASSFIGSVKSLFSPQSWKSDMKKSKLIKGKVDAREGMEPFKKPARAADWTKKKNSKR